MIWGAFTHPQHPFILMLFVDSNSNSKYIHRLSYIFLYTATADNRATVYTSFIFNFSISLLFRLIFYLSSIRGHVPHRGFLLFLSLRKVSCSFCCLKAEWHRMFFRFGGCLCALIHFGHLLFFAFLWNLQGLPLKRLYIYICPQRINNVRHEPTHFYLSFT